MLWPPLSSHFQYAYVYRLSNFLSNRDFTFLFPLVDNLSKSRKMSSHSCIFLWQMLQNQAGLNNCENSSLSSKAFCKICLTTIGSDFGNIFSICSHSTSTGTIFFLPFVVFIFDKQERKRHMLQCLLTSHFG